MRWPGRCRLSLRARNHLRLMQWATIDTNSTGSVTTYLMISFVDCTNCPPSGDVLQNARFKSCLSNQIKLRQTLPYLRLAIPSAAIPAMPHSVCYGSLHALERDVVALELLAAFSAGSLVASCTLHSCTSSRRKEPRRIGCLTNMSSRRSPNSAGSTSSLCRLAGW